MKLTARLSALAVRKTNTHEDCREATCSFCGMKRTKKCIRIGQENMVKAYIKSEYDCSMQIFPSAIPADKFTRLVILIFYFRMDLYSCKRGVDFDYIGWTQQKMKWDNFKLKCDCFDPFKHDVNSCKIC